VRRTGEPGDAHPDERDVLPAAMLQPAVVCRLARFSGPWSLAPSMMSISPPDGQFLRVHVQNAGHVLDGRVSQ
jgi:hypothetical protein